LGVIWDAFGLQSISFYDLALGGAAFGTGLNTHPEFTELASKKTAELTLMPFRSHPSTFGA
jgi:fumarate hydratase class II